MHGCKINPCIGGSDGAQPCGLIRTRMNPPQRGDKVKPVMWRVRWRDTGVPPILGPASRQDAGNTKDRREKTNTYTAVTSTKLSAPRLFVKYDVKDGDREVQQGEVARRAQMCARANGMVNRISIMHFMISDLFHPACARTIASQFISFVCG